MFERISFDRGVMGGRACVKDTRILVSTIVSQVAHGMSVEEILAEYPALKREDVRQALEYVAWLARERVVAG